MSAGGGGGITYMRNILESPISVIVRSRLFMLDAYAYAKRKTKVRGKLGENHRRVVKSTIVGETSQSADCSIDCRCGWAKLIVINQSTVGSISRISPDN